MAEMVDSPPIRNAAEWATSSRIMPPGSPIPGPFNARSTPYMISVCMAFADPAYNKITSVMGTQMGKSAAFQNIIGWRLDDDPAPIIYIGPTESNINNVVEPKILDMFRESPSLWKKFNQRSSKHKKMVAGVSLRFAWAGSSTELASDSAVITLVDELDRPPENATGEGTLDEIAEARGDAFADSKLGLTSTPVHGLASVFEHPDTGMIHWSVSDKGKISSPIWLQWEKGTRHEWSVPCPYCGDYFIPRSSLLTWPGKGTDKECTPVEALKGARLICACCGDLIADSFRKEMNSRGVAVAPGQSIIPNDNDSVLISQGGVNHVVPFHSFLHTDDGNNHFSIWVSGLCSFSAKKSYGFLARKLLEAHRSGNPSTLLSVFNTGFGEVNAVAGEAPEWEEVYSLRSRYASKEVPEGVEVLICTVDVQKNRLVFVVRGWMAGMSSRLIEFGELWGDTDKTEVWTQLDDLVSGEWGGLSLSLCAVDCGYRQPEVLAWVRRHKSMARALMGFSSMSKPFKMTRLEVSKLGKVRKNGDKRWDFDASQAKSWVHNRINWKAGEIGDWLLPSDISEDYCRQIVAEEFDPGAGKWNRIHKDNHFLDCEGMQYMGARMLRVDRKKVIVGSDVESEDSVSGSVDEVDSSDDSIKKKTRKTNRRTRKRGASGRKSGFVSRYK